jgi:adenosylcobinamide-GDP ribazoletransferase
MRDHAIGAFGAVALVVVCLVDAAATGALAVEGDAALAGLIAGAAGRAAILPLARALPYARTGPGQGRVLDGLGWTGVLVGVAIAALAAAGGGWRGVTALGAAAAVALVAALWCRAWLRGVTGDTLGATAKLCETAALVAFLAAA